MRVLIFALLLAATMFCFANEIDEIIQPLGLSKEDLKQVWHTGRCEPDWSITVDPEMLEDKELLGYKGLESGFFETEDADNEVILRAGAKCEALNAYYFKGGSQPEIGVFIGLDRRFTEKYGHTVLDAIYIEGIQFYSWNGEVSAFYLKHAKELSRKGLFTLEQKSSEFNGKPSVSFSGERTSSGDRFHDKLYK